MKRLFLVWQAPHTRHWFPVERLTRHKGGYRFVYIQGAIQAQREGQFQPIEMFPRLDGAYESEELFPLFSNRVLSAARPDYPEFVQWLNLPMED